MTRLSSPLWSRSPDTRVAMLHKGSAARTTNPTVLFSPHGSGAQSLTHEPPAKRSISSESFISAGPSHYVSTVERLSTITSQVHNNITGNITGSGSTL